MIVGAQIIGLGKFFGQKTNQLRAQEELAKNQEYERDSIVHFVHARNSDRFDPLPMCIERTGGIKKYADATRLELLKERMVDLELASYPMMQQLAESGFMERLIEVGRASRDVMTRLKVEDLASPAVLKELERVEATN